VQIAETVR
jgi:hypothetical protein